jgi:phosphotransferase system enzyme I (PtsI)
VGSKLGTVTLADCQRAAEAALAAPDPHAGRTAVREVLTAGA